MKASFEREVSFSSGTLRMILKNSLSGEVGFSCSKVTDVATISNLVVSNASVVRTYLPAGYILADGICLFGLPVDKDALIR